MSIYRRIGVLAFASMLAACSSGTAGEHAIEDRLAARADSTCLKYKPKLPSGWISSASSATTVGRQIKGLRAFHFDVRSLVSLPPQRFLAMCDYIPRDFVTDRSPTIACPNGDSVSTFEPKSFLIDETGRAIPYPIPAAPPQC